MADDSVSFVVVGWIMFLFASGLAGVFILLPGGHGNLLVPWYFVFAA